MSDLIDEVNEEMRAERARRLAQRFGGLVTGVVLLALAGVGGWEAWRWHERRESGKAAEAFLSATRDAAAEGADLKAMADRFIAMAPSAPPGYRALARLRAAALLAETGQTEQALAAYDALSRDGEVDPLYRDLASVMWGLRSLDSGDAAAIQARLTPLAVPGAPWRASAQEVLALAALKAGNTDQARTTLQALTTDAATPQGLRERAGRLLQGLGS
ncbi:tetratricopeptide repeat protein [Roseococcus sp.]|uniref:tetratricopeptide repeat protein n=1 Tax=Roseococcus sp. TaxID=2109646 RepID=UPI003BACF8D8